LYTVSWIPPTPSHTEKVYSIYLNKKVLEEEEGGKRGEYGTR
jgi:hypothetical protein